MIDRRQQLRALYGFDFPEDFFQFWGFVNRLMPLEPLVALRDATGLVLVGPFEVMAGRFDRRTPPLSPLLHWRYYMDPPEFFTVLAGSEDGFHVGYYLDDPGKQPGCLASYWARDAFEMASAGDTLFDAVRLDLEYHYRDYQDYRAEDPDNAADYDAQLREIDALRECLCCFATGDRSEVGEAYAERYAGRCSRQARVVAATREGMGIVVPPERYRSLTLKDRKLWSQLRKQRDPVEVVEEARQALRDGFPGTALKLGKDLWSFPGKTKVAHAYDLLEAAYATLRRDRLLHVLRLHRTHRDLPSVDIFDAES